MSAHRTIFGSMIVATTVMLVAPPVAQAVEQISFAYERIIWTHARQKIEDDFRRAVAAKGLKISAAEIAGAAQAAFDGGVTHTDSWEDQQMVIRGCGPAQELCFVITCNRCSAGK